MNAIKITIGITAYNSGKYLQEAIQSVLDQKSNNWLGIIILDGGSDNKSKEIFENFNHNKFQKFSFNSNQGPYGTRSKAIELSKTEWYLQLDGDDILPSDTIDKLDKAIIKNPEVEFIYGDCEIFSKTEHVIRKPFNDIEKLCHVPLYNSTSPIKKKLFNKLGGFAKNMPINADWDFWLSVYENKIKGNYVDSVIYAARKRKNNVGHRFIHLRPTIVDMIIKRHPTYFNNNERKNKARFYVYQVLARYYRSKGSRRDAAINVKKALEYGDPLPIFDSIIEEKNMNYVRFLIRRIGRKNYNFYWLYDYYKKYKFDKLELTSNVNCRSGDGHWLSNSANLNLYNILKSMGDFSKNHFVDIGCGKGGVLYLAASLFKFYKITGIERENEFVTVCNNNLNGFNNVKIECTDVNKMEIEPTMDFFYMYNPFGSETMKTFMKKIKISTKKYPRNIKILYKLPEEHEILISSGFELLNQFVLKKLRGKRHFNYESTPGYVVNYYIFNSKKG